MLLLTISEPGCLRVWHRASLGTLGLTVFSLIVLSLVSGCGLIFAPPFAPGTYSNDVACIIRAEGESGTAGEEAFDSPISLVINEDGSFEINGEPVIVGNQVLRAIPTADLSFEVIEILRSFWDVTIRYEPRPTLQGITVQGELVETYHWRDGKIELVAKTDLELTDISTTTRFTVDCMGTLISN